MNETENMDSSRNYNSKDRTGNPGSQAEQFLNEITAIGRMYGRIYTCRDGKFLQAGRTVGTGRTDGTDRGNQPEGPEQIRPNQMRSDQIETAESPKAEDILTDLFSADDFTTLLERFTDAPLEDVLEADKENPAFLRGIALRDNKGDLSSAVVLYGFLEEEETGLHFPEGLRRTTRKQLEYCTSLILSLASAFRTADRRADQLQEDLRQADERDREKEDRLKWNEARTDLLSIVETGENSEDGFKKTAEELLKAVSGYAGLTESALFELDPEEDTASMIAEFARDHSRKQNFQNVKRAELPFFSGRTYTISSDSELPENFRTYFTRAELRAAIFCPMTVGAVKSKLADTEDSENGKKKGGDKAADRTSPRFYLQFATDRNRRWDMEDIRFLNEAGRILGAFLSKKTSRDSAESSYLTVNAILEHTGCGVEVIDPARGKVLYTNTTFQRFFRSDGDRKALGRMVFLPMDETGQNYQFEAKESRKWYEVRLSEIRWVDGRRVRLVTVSDITAMKEYQTRIEQQINIDPLTGLKNRRSCDIDLREQLSRAVFRPLQNYDENPEDDSENENSKGEKRTDRSSESAQQNEAGDTGAMIYADLDDFKNINDSLGHEAGDLLLERVSEAIVRVVGAGVEVYRIGGDEFGILVPVGHHRTPEEIAKRILAEFAKPWILKDKMYYCTCSMGIAVFPRDGKDHSTVLRHADIALQRSKREGKNRYTFYTEDNSQAGIYRLDMEKAMRDAVDQGCREFEVYYQPLVDVSKPDKPCCGAEALVRWNSKELGFVSPGDFISLSEYLGLIIPIGKHVLFEACRQCRHWNDFGHPDYRVNVNLSLVQLVQKDIVATVKEALETSGLLPQNLILEVTEGLAIRDVKNLTNVLRELKSLGVGVALDDFGTGYSSLSCLKQLPLDAIKIDKCFVDHVGEDGYSDAFVTTVSRLADVMKAKVVVEGVETEKQSEVLEHMDVDFIQGYLYGKPVPKEEFEKKFVDGD